MLEHSSEGMAGEVNKLLVYYSSLAKICDKMTEKIEKSNSAEEFQKTEQSASCKEARHSGFNNFEFRQWTCASCRVCEWEETVKDYEDLKNYANESKASEICVLAIWKRFRWKYHILYTFENRYINTNSISIRGELIEKCMKMQGVHKA